VACPAPPFVDLRVRTITEIGGEMEKFYCQECGKEFKSTKSAEQAYFGDGCPKCGSADIDTGKPKKAK
jgi:NAD-dependent SIR2 family protein deacetylase